MPDTVDGSMVAGTAATPAPAPAPGATQPAVELFGSFLLGTDEFALPASCIREVVNYPDKMTVVPLSPPFLDGMFNLRGTVVPVVNLCRVFDPGAPAAERSHKIAILDYQGVLIGILFHATGEILRVRPEQRSTLRYAPAAEGAASAVIAGTILLADGARLVQVLDPAALVRIENVPQVLALQSAGRQAARRQQGERRQCVSFRAAGSSFAFDMGAIQEIIRVPEIQPSILNSALCLGRINFRGSPVAIVCFSTLLTAPGAASDANIAAREFLPDQRIVIARIDDATIGFVVDSVDSIVNYYAEDLMPIPLLSRARAGMFAGCIAGPGPIAAAGQAAPAVQADVIVLDHRQILSSAEIVEMRNGHARLYPTDDTASASMAGREARRSKRQVYLTFALDNIYAVEIKQVREIIDFTEGMSRPPGMPDFMRGMLHLRQQMISVIDLRSLYAMAPAEATSQTKILVVERTSELGVEKFGLMVDAVQNIITIEDSRRFSAPRIMRGTGADSAGPSGDMPDVIDIETDAKAVGGAPQHQTLSVFECARLLQRLAQTLPALAT